MGDHEVFESARQFLHDEVAPKAQEIDVRVDALRDALSGLCHRQLMALKRPTAYGGPAVPEDEFRQFQECVARTSGALAFLQTQHQSAVAMLARSDNEALKTDYLPKMADGERLVGIGFSQLRRSGPPVMTAEPVSGGYLLSGQVPWITGWSFYPEFLIGATLPDGQSLFAIVPLPVAPHPTITVSPPMKLAAMEKAMTVSATFDRFLVEDSKVAFIHEPGWIQNSDMINIALQGHFAFGCAMAGLDILGRNADQKPFEFLAVAHRRLSDELNDCKEATAKAQLSVGEETTEERLKVRAWAIDLAVRCAHAAVASSSGAANSLSHPAQRVYREALVYTVSAQTPAIMEATLDRIASR